MTDLTPRQSDVLQAIRENIKHHGYAPTIREIGTKLGIRSPNGVACHLKALEKKGYIEHDYASHRSLRLTDAAKGRRGIPLLNITLR